MGYFQRRKTGQTQEYQRQFDTGRFPRGENGNANPGGFFKRGNGYDPNEDYNRPGDNSGNGDFDEYGEYIGYDDGFDELTAAKEENSAEDEYEDELTEEERKEERRRHYRVMAGVGDLTAVLAGVGVILVLVAFLISMVRFVSSDLSQTVSILSTGFTK